MNSRLAVRLRNLGFFNNEWNFCFIQVSALLIPARNTRIGYFSIGRRYETVFIINLSIVDERLLDSATCN
jgi:hypothetical protein